MAEASAPPARAARGVAGVLPAVAPLAAEVVAAQVSLAVAAVPNPQVPLATKVRTAAVPKANAERAVGATVAVTPMERITAPACGGPVPQALTTVRSAPIDSAWHP